MRLELTDGKTPSDYSATIFLGYDDAKKSYVVHWLDTFGGAFSETLGYGSRSENKLIFDFAYPEGRFRNTFMRDTQNDNWTFLMQNSDGKDDWKFFAQYVLMRKK